MVYDKTQFTFSADAQLNARDELFSLCENYNIPKDEKERSLSLFLRGSQLARIFALQEVYQNILNVPGSILDFGTWRGGSAVICENLRAIYEPLNFQRHIYAFDTFEGYAGFEENEAVTKNVSNGTYGVEKNYHLYLEHLLKLHEQNNAMGHINGKHSVIKGNVTQTFPELLSKNKGLCIALAFFDLNCLKPTQETLELVLERLLVGGVLAMWQFTRKEIQAESEAFFSLIHNKVNYTIYTCKTYPSLVYIKKEK